MELEKIKESDLEGKGVRGQADVPGISASEMQEKVEEIARFAIEKINEIIDYLFENGASKEDLQKLLIDAGAVSSVFGRAGDVKAREGDYTAEMVGAAEKIHARHHAMDGIDPIRPEDIMAADKAHIHGNITEEGTIGETNGMVLMTGLLGKIEAKAKNEAGFILRPEVKSIGGGFTAEDNVEYTGDKITEFIFSCDEEKKAACHGFFTFGEPSAISIDKDSFYYVYDPDDISSAEEGSRWEFDLLKGCLIIRKRSE